MPTRSSVGPGTAPSGLQGAGVRLARLTAGALEPVDAHVGDLAHPGVGADGLAEIRLGALHVEDVVDDLEEQAELAGEPPQRRVDRRLGPREHEGAVHRARHEPAGLQRVHAAQRRRRLAPRVLEVEVLAADHAADAGRPADLEQDPDLHGRPAGLALGHQADGLGEEGVAGQDGGVLAEQLVAGRPPAAQVVVVHRRQVVVDQRVGVHQLERRGRRQQALRLLAERLAGREREDRAHPLAAGEQRVPHRLDEALGAAPSPGARSDRSAAKSRSSR